jgi:hypothetical protein
MTKLFGSAALLLTLFGCGGGANGATPAPSPAPGAAGLEEETAAKTPGNKPAEPAKPAGPKIDPSLIPQPGSTLQRETYEYAGGSRDPFASVLEGTSVGPELADLDLTGIYYMDRAPAMSVAVLKDRVSGKRYSVREGERVGRARVSDIKPKEVTFTVDDYGTQRQVTLSIRKREDITP